MEDTLMNQWLSVKSTSQNDHSLPDESVVSDCAFLHASAFMRWKVSFGDCFIWEKSRRSKRGCYGLKDVKNWIGHLRNPLFIWESFLHNWELHYSFEKVIVHLRDRVHISGFHCAFLRRVPISHSFAQSCRRIHKLLQPLEMLRLIFAKDPAIQELDVAPLKWFGVAKRKNHGINKKLSLLLNSEVKDEFISSYCIKWVDYEVISAVNTTSSLKVRIPPLYLQY
jgi:hypothetical protein